MLINIPYQHHSTVLLCILVFIGIGVGGFVYLFLSFSSLVYFSTSINGYKFLIYAKHGKPKVKECGAKKFNQRQIEPARKLIFETERENAMTEIHEFDECFAFISVWISSIFYSFHSNVIPDIDKITP